MQAYVLTSGRQYIFYIAAAVTAVNAVLFLFIRESRPSLLLAQTVTQLKQATNDDTLFVQNPDHYPGFHDFVRTALFRPVHLLFTEPIVFVVSIMTAIAFGLIYLFTEALQVVYREYGFSIPQTSLSYIVIAIGLFFGFLVRLFDHKAVQKRKKAGTNTKPEDMLTGFTIAAPVLAIALWWFAWTVPPRVHTHWSVSMVALIPIGFAFNEIDNVLAGYMSDSYTLYSASAFASLSIVRTLFSATFPLFGRQMYENLSPNYASTIVAALATIACVSPILLLRYGERLRERSKFARYSLKVHNENAVD